MNSKAQHLLVSSHNWFKNSVFPLWSERGIDPKNGGFVESLSPEGQPTSSPRRAMVQARQLYAFSEGLKMQVVPRDLVAPVLEKSTAFLLQNYSLDSGAFLHAVHSDGAPESLQSELYTQAFVLFGLARSYEVLRKPEYKIRALNLYSYLERERRNPAGGFTEIKNGKTVFQSNPHMHLFEAVLAWALIDEDPLWRMACDEIYQLCRTRFVDIESGTLCENFDSQWQPLRENGRFYFEPGHHYEWAWLLVQYEKLSGVSVGHLPQQLFELAEKYGVQRRETFAREGLFAFAIDEVWNDLTVKKASARFWPQTERIKAAVELGMKAAGSEQKRFAAAADEAVEALWVYLDSPLKGTWQDTLSDTGDFIPLAPKASSLYHIICAMSEYALKRPALADE